MGKIIITEFVSLDGVAEAPEKWSLNFWNAETEKFKTDELHAHDAMLLGRVTYEGFAAAWPSRSGDFADRFNGMPKFVASRTLKSTSWNGSQLLAAPLNDAVIALKAKTGGSIYVHGSIGLSQALIAAALVDEIHLLTYPILLGSGRRLFGEGSQTTLELFDATTFSNGVQAQRFRVKAA